MSEWVELLNGPDVSHLTPREQWVRAWTYARVLRKWAYLGDSPRPVEHPSSWNTREPVSRWTANPYAHDAVLCLRRRDRRRWTRTQFWLTGRRLNHW